MSVQINQKSKHQSLRFESELSVSQQTESMSATKQYLDLKLLNKLARLLNISGVILSFDSLIKFSQAEADPGEG